jgi:hypothetical protein
MFCCGGNTVRMNKGYLMVPVYVFALHQILVQHTTEYITYNYCFLRVQKIILLSIYMRSMNNYRSGARVNFFHLLLRFILFPMTWTFQYTDHNTHNDNIKLKTSYTTDTLLYKPTRKRSTIIFVFITQRTNDHVVGGRRKTVF